MKLINRANLSAEKLAQLESELVGQQNVNDVLKWAAKHPQGVFIPSVVADVVIQDEFTYDVIVPYRDRLVLVYGAT